MMRGVAYLCAGACAGGSADCWPATGGFVGRQGAFVDAVRRAVAMPMGRPGASCRRDVFSGVCGGLGVCHGFVPGDGLGRLFRYYADRLDGRLAHAAVFAFGLGAGRPRRRRIKKTRQCACSKAEARRVYWLESITFSRCRTGHATAASSGGSRLSRAPRGSRQRPWPSARLGRRAPAGSRLLQGAQGTRALYPSWAGPIPL